MTDDQKNWVLTFENGKELYSEVYKLLNGRKIKQSVATEMFAFWLNQRNVRHDTPLNYSKSSKRFIKNESEPRLFWEKYDPNVSVQTLKNEFQMAWHNRGQKLIESVQTICN